MNSSKDKWVGTAAAALLVSATFVVCAEEVNHTENAKKAGRAVVEGVRDIGKEAKKAGNVVVNAGKEGFNAAKETGKEIGQKVKGEK